MRLSVFSLLSLPRVSDKGRPIGLCYVYGHSSGFVLGRLSLLVKHFGNERVCFKTPGVRFDVFVNFKSIFVTCIKDFDGGLSCQRP